jgi:hypothetical protein
MKAKQKVMAKKTVEPKVVDPRPMHERWLELYVQHHDAYRAFEELGVDPGMFNVWKKTIPSFKAAKQDADVLLGLKVQDTMMSHLVEGTVKPVFQQGVQVGEVTDHADAHAVPLLKLLTPGSLVDTHAMQGGDPDKPLKSEVTVKGLSPESIESIKRHALGIHDEPEKK